MVISLNHQGEIRLLLYNEAKIIMSETQLTRLSKDSPLNTGRLIVASDHFGIKV